MFRHFYLVPRIGRVAYLNNPKCACTSILSALSRMRSEPNFEPPGALLPDGSHPIHGFVPPDRHLHLFAIRWYADWPPLPEGLVRFTFVRNPYRRFLSFFKSKVVTWQNPAPYYERFGVHRGMSFDACVRAIVGVPPEELEHHAMPQAMLVMDDCVPRVDFVGRVEHMDQDWPVITGLTGVDVALERLNTFSDGEALPYTAETRDLIYEYYRDDFRLFGYERDSVEAGSSSSIASPGTSHSFHFPASTLSSAKAELDRRTHEVRARSGASGGSGSPAPLSPSNEEILREMLFRLSWDHDERIRLLEMARDHRLVALEGQLAVVGQEIRRSKEKLDQVQHQLRQETSRSRAEMGRMTTEVRRLVGAVFSAGRLRSGVERQLHARGEREILVIERSGQFDSGLYLRQHPLVAERGMDPLRHYVEYGAAQGFSPNEGFDTERYLLDHPDLLASGENPFSHFLRQEAKERGAPSSPSIMGTGLRVGRRVAGRVSARIRRRSRPR